MTLYVIKILNRGEMGNLGERASMKGKIKYLYVIDNAQFPSLITVMEA